MLQNSAQKGNYVIVLCISSHVQRIRACDSITLYRVINSEGNNVYEHSAYYDCKVDEYLRQ